MDRIGIEVFGIFPISYFFFFFFFVSECSVPIPVFPECENAFRFWKASENRTFRNLYYHIFSENFEIFSGI